MTKRSFYDFKNQFTTEYIDKVKVPYNVLLKNFISDTTTYDDILDYFTIDISSDGTSISCNMIEYQDDAYSYPTAEEYNFSIPQDLNYIYDYYNDSNNPRSHQIGVKLSPDNTTVLINKPFADTTITLSETMKLHPTPSTEMYYSSYNEHMILPKEQLLYDEYFEEFATDIYKQANDTTKTELKNKYELHLFSPAAMLSLNKNFKFGFHFDSSLLGVKNNNDFQQNPNVKYWPNNTNVTNELVDSYYEYESDYKLNGQLLIDSDITSYVGSYNLNIDTTIFIESENYKINRAHVPPMRYLGSGDFSTDTPEKYYQPTIAFNDKNNYRHVKIKHENHSQFTEATGINAALNSLKNETNSEFLVEFDGYNEVIELN